VPGIFHYCVDLIWSSIFKHCLFIFKRIIGEFIYK